MAWSPIRRANAGCFEVGHPGDYATHNSNQLRDGTAREKGFYEKPSEQFASMEAIIGIAASQWWFRYLAVLLIGITLGLWADIALRKADRRESSKASALREIGTDCQIASSNLYHEGRYLDVPTINYPIIATTLISLRACPKRR